jgi:DNA repair exonuclease SbcCD nuclease subunit
MSRIAFISDIHCNLRLPMARVDAGGVHSDRLRDALGCLEQAAAACLELGVTQLYILGDLYDQKHPDGATLVHTSKTLRDIADKGLEVLILPGNHDAVDRDGRMYTLMFYGSLRVPGVRVLGHESIEVTPGTLLHAVPWLPERRAAERIKALDKGASSDRNVLLFHQSVIGAVGDTGWVSDEGLEAGRVADGLDLALSGHYHRPQAHSWGRYLGAPMHMRFGDESDGLPRGFWWVDLDDAVLKPQMVALDSPLFATDRVRLDDGDNIEDLVDIAESAHGADYLRIIVEGSPAAIERNTKTLLKWKGDADSMGLRLIKVDARPDRKPSGAHRLKVNPSLAPEAIATKYAEQQGIEADWLAIGKDILKEVTK